MMPNKELYRDPDKGKIAGVCAGLADYFGLETWLVRILVVTGFFLLAGPFVIVSYIAAWFILEKKPANATLETNQETKATFSGKGWHSQPAKEESKVEVKAKVWQAGEPPRKAFFHIKQQFTRNEFRLRKLETYVTSSEFQLNREFNKL